MSWEHQGHEVNISETEIRTFYTTWTEEWELHLYDSTAGDGHGDYKADCITCGKYGLELPSTIELVF